MAFEYNLEIDQGTTFQKRFVPTVKSLVKTATTSAAYGIGATTIVLAAGGAGALIAGEWITFGDSVNPYKVTTGIADLSAGGSAVIAGGLIESVAIGSTVSIYTAVSLTGKTFRGQIRSITSSGKVLATLALSVVSDAIQVDLTDDITTAIPAGGPTYNDKTIHVFDIESEVTLTGVVERLVNGLAIISPEVTR